MEGFGSRAVAAITGLTRRQIDYWDRSNVIRPSLSTSSGKGTRRLYNFVDLVQFRVAAALRAQGISLQKIRKAIIFLRKSRRELERPLASLKFLTDGDTIFVLTSDRKVVVDTLTEGQLVFSIAIGKLLSDLREKAKGAGEARIYPVYVGKRRFSATLHGDLEEGGYWVECPDLPGCMSQGETIEEALEMIRDAIRGHLAVTERPTRRRKAV